MKANFLAWMLAIFPLIATAFQLSAQQTATATNSFGEIKAKAEKGDAQAQYELGMKYALGDDVTNDSELAAKWYRKAAEQGNPRGQCSLAGMYQNGYGVPKEFDEAIKWYRKAADQDDDLGQFSLGWIYYKGEIVPQNLMEAMKWFKKAAVHDDTLAQCQVAQMYENGEGVLKDSVESVKWYRKAAERGWPFAQLDLGSAYANGDGVPIDYIEAYKWYNLALENSNGIKLEKDNLHRLEQKMTPEQIAEAQRRSVAFVPRKKGQISISASPENLTASGSGFFITDDGYLISNYHVVKDATKVRLVTSAGTVDAKVVQVDAANDLALLKADGKSSPLPIAASRSAHLGGTVATIGFPDPSLQGFSPKLAKGEIASLSGASDDPRYFQVSLPVQPGNSGGALVDERGNVIGIVSAKLDAAVALAASGALPENVNYAVKSSLLLSFLESVPAVSAKLKAANTVDEKFEEVVKSAQAAAVLVLVY